MTMKIFYLTKKGPILTGSGTYRDTVLNEMAKRHEIKVFETDADLREDWDIVHVLDIKHLNPEIISRIQSPLLIEIHDYQWIYFQPFFAIDLPLRFLLQKYRKQKYSRIINRADGIIAHSNYVLERILHPNKSLVTIGIDPSVFETPSITKPSSNNILMVGRDYFQKGLSTALKALPIILKSVPDARLTVIGKEYPHSKFIAKMLAKNLPVSYIDGVPRELINKYYNEASVFIHPSEIEAFGIVLLEAMASELPIVASKVGGIPEVVENNVNGYLIERGDYNELASKVIALLTTPEMASRLGKEGKRIVKERFTIERMIKDIENAYSKLIRSQKL